MIEQNKTITVGAGMLAEVLREQGVEPVEVDWKPPLQRLRPAPVVDEANREAVKRMTSVHPVWVGVGIAKQTIPGMRSDLLLHSGPPLRWKDASGPMRGALEGALRLESRTSADLDPCHHHETVGPMAGVISASMAVVVVEDRETGRRAYSYLSEPPGKSLRFGANDDDVLNRLRWMSRVLAPDLEQALTRHPVDLGMINQRALQMGDELHNRHAAANLLLMRELALRGTSSDTLRFIDANDYFYLTLAMAAAKLACDAAAGVAKSTLVVTMARNGTEFGIRVSGSPDRWFTAPAEVPHGLFFGGYSESDANPDMGDSAIMETYGLGGFASAAAPAIALVIGGSAESAREATMEMYEITIAEHPNHRIPLLGFRGTPTGIDTRRVVETGIRAIINTGIAHRRAGVGQIGAGISRAPLQPFIDAYNALETSS